jgi:hypothetical protein
MFLNVNLWLLQDEKFDKLFKAYAKKVDLNPSNLSFIFDGDKINPASTPQDLDLEDEDMIEVRHKPAEHVILHKPTEPHVKKARQKILISIQGKDGKLQFRVSKVWFFHDAVISVNLQFKMYSPVR